MDTRALLQHLESQGFSFTLGEEGRLLVAPKAAITPQLADLIRTHKPALIAALRAPTAGISPDPDDVREFYEERAAIMEHDANLPRPEAEAHALRLAVVRFKLHQGEGSGSVVAPNCTIAEVLADLKARYGDRLKEAYPLNTEEPQP